MLFIRSMAFDSNYWEKIRVKIYLYFSFNSLDINLFFFISHAGCSMIFSWSTAFAIIFSAPNYCGDFDNAGATISVAESLMYSFQILKHVDWRPWIKWWIEVLQVHSWFGLSDSQIRHLFSQNFKFLCSSLTHVGQ